MVDNEEEGSVDGQSRRKSRKHGSTPHCEVITALVDRHNRFMEHLKKSNRNSLGLISSQPRSRRSDSSVTSGLTKGLLVLNHVQT